VTSLALEHFRYIRDRPYRREFNARLRRLIAEEPRAISQMTVVHEDDGRCCRREPWPVTYTQLVRAIQADGERVVGVVL